MRLYWLAMESLLFQRVVSGAKGSDFTNLSPLAQQFWVTVMKEASGLLAK